MKATQKLIFKAWDNISKGDEKRKANQKPTSGITENNNITYIDDGNKNHLLDVYYPRATTKKLPVIFDVHGGGWVYGDKEINKYYCLSLASRGFTVVNISYTLCPEAKINNQVADIFAALHWLEKNGSDYFCDLDNVFLTGDSAGGHLASLVAVIYGSPEVQRVYDVKPTSFKINAVGVTCGVCDLGMFVEQKYPVLGEYAKIMLGDNYKKSPYCKYVSIKDVIGGVKMPPFYIVSSKQDIYNFQSIRFDKLLTENGVEHYFHNWDKVKGKSLQHVFNILFPEWEESIITNDEMTNFFRKYIKEEAVNK